MVIKFQNNEDAISGKLTLTLADLSTSIPHFIEPGRYYSLVTSPEEVAGATERGSRGSHGNTAAYTVPSSDGPAFDGEQLKEDEETRTLNTKRFGPLGSPTRPAHRSCTIYLGQIPVELLKDTEDIRMRFTRYGPLRDQRIRMYFMSPILQSIVLTRHILPAAKSSLIGARGSMFLEYYRQEDADALFDDLQLNPLFLFGRRVIVDYEALMPESRKHVVDSCIQLRGVDDALFEDPWALWETIYEIAPPIDLRPSKNPESNCNWLNKLMVTG